MVANEANILLDKVSKLNDYETKKANLITEKDDDL